MIDSKDILTLLSIPSENISNVSIISDTKDISYIDIELKDIRTNCPFCFSDKIGINVKELLNKLFIYLKNMKLSLIKQKNSLNQCY